MSRRRSAAVALIALLTACPSDAPPGSPPASASQEPGATRGGELRVVLASDVDALDPHRAATPASWFFARAIHRGLLAFPNDPFPAGARPVADLAADWRANRTFTRYTFTLRAGPRFPAPVDRPVRAADVRASVERVVREGRGLARFLGVIRGVRAVRRGRTSRVRGISTPDERTVVFRLERPANDLPWILAHPQLAVLPAETPEPGRIAPGRIAGLGPYAIRRYLPERSIRLARNQSWSADPVRAAYVDEIAATLGVPARTAVRDVTAGTADLVLDTGPPDLAGPRIPRRARVVTTASGCVRYVFLNREVAPFGRRAARLRVASALRPRSVLPPTVFGHRDEVRGPAGRTSGGFRTTVVIADSPRDRAEARRVRRALGRAGIEVRVRAVPPALVHGSYYENPSSRTPMGIATWCADWPGVAGRNVLGAIADPRAPASTAYAHPAGAALVRAINRASRATDRRAPRAWAAADEAAVRAAFVIPLGHPVERMVVSRRLRRTLGTPMWPRGDPSNLWLATED